MRSAFPGFPPEGLEFFRKLARNNKRDWFQPRKHVFEQTLKEPMRDLVVEVNHAMSRFAPAYVTDPAKAVYRIYRDTRFSKDKTPYKTHLAASFPRHDTPEGAGFYFAVSHKSVEIGGGIYMPSPETLRAMRNHIAEHHRELRKIVSAAAVRRLFGGLQGEQLTRIPKGFDAENPAADLLKFKQYLLYVELQPEIATTAGIFTEIASHFRAMTPFIEFLNAPLTRKRKPLLPEF